MCRVLGQQARDALLLIMQLSHRNEYIARHIAEHTNFCPVNVMMNEREEMMLVV